MNNDIRNMFIILPIVYGLMMSYFVYVNIYPRPYEDCRTYISFSENKNTTIFDQCMNLIHPNKGLTKEDMQESLKRLEKYFGN